MFDVRTHTHTHVYRFAPQWQSAPITCSICAACSARPPSRHWDMWAQRAWFVIIMFVVVIGGGLVVCAGWRTSTWRIYGCAPRSVHATHVMWIRAAISILCINDVNRGGDCGAWSLRPRYGEVEKCGHQSWKYAAFDMGIQEIVHYIRLASKYVYTILKADGCGGLRRWYFFLLIFRFIVIVNCVQKH